MASQHVEDVLVGSPAKLLDFKMYLGALFLSLLPVNDREAKWGSKDTSQDGTWPCSENLINNIVDAPEEKSPAQPCTAILALQF